MADWRHFQNVEYNSIYRKLNSCLGEYEVVLMVNESTIPDFHRIPIMDSELSKQLDNLVTGKAKRIYLACGMQDIDIYKLDSGYGITYSPHDGLNVQYLLKDEDIKKLCADVKLDNNMKH